MLEHAGVNLNFPHTDDPLVAALQRLILRIGSYSAIADRADVNDQSLYQVAMAKPHSVTGRPKSVGPNMRKKLDAAFPGWLDLATPSATAPTPTPDLPATATAQVAPLARWPHERFPRQWWELLSPAERAVVEEAMLDAYDRVMSRREQLASAAGKTGRSAA